MFKIKLYLYDSLAILTTPILRVRTDGLAWNDYGFRGTDLSQYVMIGGNYAEDITSVLDSGELTLMGYNRATEFDPETKFILDFYNDDIWLETYHIVCKQDLVEQPILTDNTYYNHNISFYEPSVLAQKHICDNMSCTYKLKDVSLSEHTALPIEQTMDNFNINTAYTPTNTFGTYTTSHDGSYKVYGKYFKTYGTAKFCKNDYTESNLFYQNINDYNIAGEGETPVYKARYKMVLLQVYTGVKNTRNFVFRGNVSYDYRVIETNEHGTRSVVESGSYISNYNMSVNASQSDWWSGGSTELNSSWLLEDIQGAGDIATNTNYYFRKYTDTSADAPSIYTNAFTIKADCNYLLEISLHTFNDNLPEQTFSSTEKGYKSTQFSKLIVYHTTILRSWDRTIVNYSSENLTDTIKNQTYSSSTARAVLASAIPYSALKLIEKTCLNTSVFDKISGYAINEINIVNNAIHSNCQWYVDESFVGELDTTQVIEDFYNQKNLWEILCIIGNYIHCIPTIRFGKDNKYCISFYRLGRTDKKIDTAYRKSINNYRGIDDYVSACSSYITNMVQLGGNVKELTAPKVSSSTIEYNNTLIYNDTALLEVQKPIIELLSIQVKCNTTDYSGIGIMLNATADMTPYVYEKNVYNLLSVLYTDTPNKGIALYYNLSDTKIDGLNYQLPQESTNEYTDYAIKKVIYCAFHQTADNIYAGYEVRPTPQAQGVWATIKVNDFSFTITYRTKDSVRQNQCRPDLRHFMKTSPYDRVPTHNQFNNQQDLVVDSVAFGNNVFGKLIKSGNTNYEINEWATDYLQLKHKGELYEIYGELYYVARVTHYFYPNHFESHVVYSKDYNELSPIIGIPSEPRFYEISEQSLIRREVAIDDYILLTDNATQLDFNKTRLFNSDHLLDLMFAQNTDFARWVITSFKGDKDSTGTDITLGLKTFKKDILMPLNAYSSENTLTYSWDCKDNFSAGDKVVATNKENYNTIQAVQYCDMYGKSALFDFYILGDLSSGLTFNQIKALPSSPINTSTNALLPYGSLLFATNDKTYNYSDKNGFGLSLFKDCREALSFNYNLQLLTNSDTFIISPFIFLPNKRNVKVVLLNKEVNKLNNGYIDKDNDVITPYNTSSVALDPYFNLSLTKIRQYNTTFSINRVIVGQINLSTMFTNINDMHFSDSATGEIQRVKAIAIVCNVSLDSTIDTTLGIPSKQQFIIARNIPSTWTKAQATADWHIGGAGNSLFTKHQ